MIKDSFLRVHDYLRISLTDHCNLRCSYCMPNEDYTFAPNKDLMQTNELLDIAKIFVDLGVKKIRLTGGEPLVHKDAGTIITALSKMPIELALTTNATRTHIYFDHLVRAKLSSVNVSLDTLKKEKFILMTKRNYFDTVINNIEQLIDRGVNVKVNVVLIKGVNDDELMDFINWTKKNIQVRFIEFMPFTGNKWSNNKLVTYEQILEKVSKFYAYEKIDKKPHDTCKAYKIEGFKGTFAIISTMTQPFCGDCNRMRLTADGKFKNCLFSTTETDLLSSYRSGKSIIPLIHQSIKEKKAALGGQITPHLDDLQANKLVNRSMISIGG